MFLEDMPNHPGYESFHERKLLGLTLPGDKMENYGKLCKPQKTAVNIKFGSLITCNWIAFSVDIFIVAHSCSLYGDLTAIHGAQDSGNTFFSTFLPMIYCALFPVGNLIKSGVRCHTIALHTLLYTRQAVTLQTLNRSETERRHSGLPNIQRVTSICLFRSTGGLPPPPVNSGISGRPDSIASKVVTVCLDIRKWLRKSSMLYCGIVSSKYSSLRTLHLLVVFVDGRRTRKSSSSVVERRACSICIRQKRALQKI